MARDAALPPRRTGSDDRNCLRREQFELFRSCGRADSDRGQTGFLSGARCIRSRRLDMSEQTEANFDIERRTDAAVPNLSRRVLLTAAAAGAAGFAFAQNPARAAIVRTDITKLPPYGNFTVPSGIRSRAVNNGSG